MADLASIKALIELSGYKRQFIAKNIHMSPFVLNSRLKGKTEFKLSEAMELAAFLHLTFEERERYFFGDAKGGRPYDQ